jgi:hypothetical protein
MKISFQCINKPPIKSLVFDMMNNKNVPKFWTICYHRPFGAVEASSRPE